MHQWMDYNYSSLGRFGKRQLSSDVHGIVIIIVVVVIIITATSYTAVTTCRHSSLSILHGSSHLVFTSIL